MSTPQKVHRNLTSVFANVESKLQLCRLKKKPKKLALQTQAERPISRVLEEIDHVNTTPENVKKNA